MAVPILMRVCGGQCWAAQLVLVNPMAMFVRFPLDEVSVVAR